LTLSRDRYDVIVDPKGVGSFMYGKQIEETETRARTIYQETTACLMAHSIRAVQTYLKRYHKAKQISVHLVPKMHESIERYSWLVDNGGDEAKIWVDADQPTDRKRICIAHELYHILLWSDPSVSDIPKNAAMSEKDAEEEFCDLFANRLCRAHDDFYRSGDAYKAGIFSVEFPVRANPKKPKIYNIDPDGTTTEVLGPQGSGLAADL